MRAPGSNVVALSLAVTLGLILTPTAVFGSSPTAAGPLRIAGNIDQCTNSYNFCVASCSTQQNRCTANGNASDYCSAAYNTCAVGCRNHLDSCVK